MMASEPNFSLLQYRLIRATMLRSIADTRAKLRDPATGPWTAANLAERVKSLQEAFSRVRRETAFA